MRKSAKKSVSAATFETRWSVALLQGLQPVIVMHSGVVAFGANDPDNRI